MRPGLAVITHQEVCGRELIAREAAEELEGRGSERDGSAAGLPGNRQRSGPVIERAAAGAGELAGATAGVHGCLDEVARAAGSVREQCPALADVEEELATLRCALEWCHACPLLG